MLYIVSIFTQILLLELRSINPLLHFASGDPKKNQALPECITTRFAPTWQQNSGFALNNAATEHAPGYQARRLVIGRRY